MNVRKIVRIAIVSALYVALTVINPFSFNYIQLRLSECLMILCLFKKEYIISLFIGTIISNLFSPLGVIDVLIGGLATLISGILMYKLKHKILALLSPCVINAIFVSLELYILKLQPLFILSFVFIFISEAIVIFIIGLPITGLIKRKRLFESEITKDDTNVK